MPETLGTQSFRAFGFSGVLVTWVPVNTQEYRSEGSAHRSAQNGPAGGIVMAGLIREGGNGSR